MSPADLEKTPAAHPLLSSSKGAKRQEEKQGMKKVHSSKRKRNQPLNRIQKLLQEDEEQKDAAILAEDALISKLGSKLGVSNERGLKRLEK